MNRKQTYWLFGLVFLWCACNPAGEEEELVAFPIVYEYSGNAPMELAYFRLLPEGLESIEPDPLSRLEGTYFHPDTMIREINEDAFIRQFKFISADSLEVYIEEVINADTMGLTFQGTWEAVDEYLHILLPIGEWYFPIEKLGADQMDIPLLVGWYFYLDPFFQERTTSYYSAELFPLKIPATMENLADYFHETYGVGDELVSGDTLAIFRGSYLYDLQQ